VSLRRGLRTTLPNDAAASPPRVRLGCRMAISASVRSKTSMASCCALIAPRLREGSRGGPVTHRETTRTDGVARERKCPVHGPDRSIAAGHRTGPSNLAKVGVAGSNPVVRSRSGAVSALRLARRVPSLPRQLAGSALRRDRRVTTNPQPRCGAGRLGVDDLEEPPPRGPAPFGRATPG
jgi:hypothetical protein